MAATKRTKAQREADLEFLAPLYVRGLTQGELAQRLAAERPYALSEKQIGYDLRALLERWRTSQAAEIATAQGVELRKLDMIEREGWKAWDKSAVDGPGDPRFLSVLQGCHDRRCELLGLKDAALVSLELRVAHIEGRT